MSYSSKSFLTIFLVKSKLSTAKRVQNPHIFTSFSPEKKSTIFPDQSWIFGQKWRFRTVCKLREIVWARFGKSQLLNAPILANQNKNKMARKFKYLQFFQCCKMKLFGDFFNHCVNRASLTNSGIWANLQMHSPPQKMQQWSPKGDKLYVKCLVNSYCCSIS